jgi:antitoxin component YwqK of YwqJK toxin-antitoxin module
MKNTLLYLVLVLLSVQCSQKDNSNIDQSAESETSVYYDSSKIKDSEITLDVTNSVPTEKLKNGDFKSYFPEGQLKVSGFVEQGKRVGVWISYFPNGNKQSENNYVNGMLSGKTVVLYSNGQIMYIGYYNNGAPDGEWLYYDETGKMTKHLNYKGGVPHDLPLD